MSAGPGTTRTVTINTGSGSGTIRLDLKNASPAITDTVGNALTATFNGGTVLNVDRGAPTINFTAPTGATSQTSTTVNVAWSESDSGSGINAATRQSRARRRPRSHACSAVSWSNDGAATTAASPRNDTGLLTNTCYQWLANISDNAGNPAPQATSGTVLVDTTAPVVTFTSPTGATAQSSTSVNVTWSESDSGSGINAATRSVQRQSGAPVANACTSATFTNDGAATTAASPRNDTLLTGNTCYRWRVTLVDNAGNSATTTSGTVLIDTTAPTINFTAPTGATSQTSTTVNVAWSESDSGLGDQRGDPLDPAPEGDPRRQRLLRGQLEQRRRGHHGRQPAQ